MITLACILHTGGGRWHYFPRALKVPKSKQKSRPTKRLFSEIRRLISQRWALFHAFSHDRLFICSPFDSRNAKLHRSLPISSEFILVLLNRIREKRWNTCTVPNLCRKDWRYRYWTCLVLSISFVKSMSSFAYLFFSRSPQSRQTTNELRKHVAAPTLRSGNIMKPTTTWRTDWEKSTRTFSPFLLTPKADGLGKKWSKYLARSFGYCHQKST